MSKANQPYDGMFTKIAQGCPWVATILEFGSPST